MLCPADKKRERAGAIELGKLLTPESCLLHVVSSEQEEGESRCNETEWARCLSLKEASSMLCPAGKKCMKTGAMELGKVLTQESCLLHVVPSEQKAGENRCNGTGQGVYPGEPPPPSCAQQARSGC
jgi:hypothetical protein